MPKDFIEFNRYMPGIALYEKDMNSAYQEANDVIVNMFGLKNHDQIYGLLDYNIPCPMSESAEIYRENDRFVMGIKESMQFFEILDCADRGISMFLTTKTPKLDAEKNIIGIFGCGVSLSSLFMNIAKVLIKPEGKRNHSLRQASYTIGKKPGFDLTTRQLECLFFILRGKSSKEIAKALKLSPRTVETYLECIKNKFNCNTKSELIESAMSQGFFYLIPPTLFTQQLSLLIG